MDGHWRALGVLNDVDLAGLYVKQEEVAAHARSLGVAAGGVAAAVGAWRAACVNAGVVVTFNASALVRQRKAVQQRRASARYAATSAEGDARPARCLVVQAGHSAQGALPLELRVFMALLHYVRTSAGTVTTLARLVLLATAGCVHFQHLKGRALSVPRRVCLCFGALKSNKRCRGPDRASHVQFLATCSQGWMSWAPWCPSSKGGT